MTATTEPTRPRDRRIWSCRARGCALIVADVTADSSYRHQRGFALGGGSDLTGVALWPLSEDGLPVLATIGLLKPRYQTSRRFRVTVWMTTVLIAGGRHLFVSVVGRTLG